MVLINQSGKEALPIGSEAPEFSGLPGTDGQSYGLESFQDSKAVVICFTCNHCPYAQAYEDRFIDLVRTFSPQGIAFIAINANDAENYPDDGFEEMKKRAETRNFPFPYVRDESQEVAKAYGAACTPHIFVLDRDRKLIYEGGIDDNWKEPDKAIPHLKQALEAIVNDQPVPNAQTNPLGCSIKWK